MNFKWNEIKNQLLCHASDNNLDCLQRYRKAGKKSFNLNSIFTKSQIFDFHKKTFFFLASRWRAATVELDSAQDDGLSSANVFSK